MGMTSVRVDETTRDTLRQLAAESGEPMRAVLERAIECYRRQRFFDQVSAAYAALRADTEAWEEELEERRAWDGALVDGLEET